MGQNEDLQASLAGRSLDSGILFRPHRITRFSARLERSPHSRTAAKSPRLAQAMMQPMSPPAPQSLSQSMMQPAQPKVALPAGPQEPKVMTIPIHIDVVGVHQG